MLLALACPLACAGPPFVTDDPEPVDDGTWEVNYAFTGTHNQDGTAGFLPQVDANYGIAPGVQLHLQPQWAFNQQTGENSHGPGDTQLGVKYRLTPASQPEDAWMISVYPLLNLPTGDASRNLGAGASSLYLPVWFQTTREQWTFYGGSGYWVNYGANSRNAWAGGWVALYQFTPRLQFGGEVFGETAQTIEGQGTIGFNLGGNYQLAREYSLLFSVGKGLANVAASNQASAYLALQVLY